MDGRIEPDLFSTSTLSTVFVASPMVIVPSSLMTIFTGADSLLYPSGYCISVRKYVSASSPIIVKLPFSGVVTFVIFVIPSASLFFATR